MRHEQLVTCAWRISTRTAILAACLAVALAGADAPAAIVTLTDDVFDSDSDISTAGTLVEAYNLGWATGVTANGVLFAPDPGGSAFMAATGTDYDTASLYGGGAIGSMSFSETHRLLDTVEYGPGTDNSVARLDGLTPGQEYLVQVLVVDDRSGNGNVTYSFGYATPSGDATETYTLTGVDCTSSSPHVISGTFTADESSQDLHIRTSGAGNGMAAAYQLRAVPEPATMSLLVLGGLAVLKRRR